MQPPTDLIIETLIWCALLPGAVALAVLGLHRLLPNVGEPAARAATALAVAGGVFAGFVAMDAATIRPNAPVLWLPWLALIAGAVGVVEALPELPLALGWMLRIATAVLAAWLLVPNTEYLAAIRVWCWVGIVIGVLANWTALDFAAGHQPGGWLTAALVPGVVAAALVLEEIGILKYAQFAGILAAALGASALMLRGRSARGVAGPVAVLLIGLIAEGYFGSSSEMNPAGYFLVALTPLPLAAASLSRRVVAWRIAAVLAVVVPAGVAVALAILPGLNETNG